MAQGRFKEVRVGIFVVGLMIALGGSLYVAGGGSDLLEDTYTLHGSWEDVGGLKEGAVVRLAGWDVGEVSRIRFSDDLGVRELSVEMQIFTEFQDRIRADSEARIDTVGVLGDKYVAITMGDPETDVLESGDFIDTRPPLDIVEYTKQVAEVLESTSSIGRKVDLMIGTDEQAAEAALSDSFMHIETILAQAEHGDGLIHTLLYDETVPQRIDQALDSLTETLQSFGTIVVGVEQAMSAIQEGDGLAHELIYGEDGTALAVQLNTLSTQMSDLVGDIENGEGLVSTLLYDPEAATIVNELQSVATNLQTFSETLNEADGTLNLLVRDPTLYEDMSALVGGAQRNKLLRAFIRRTVDRAEDTSARPWEPVE